MYLKSKNFLLFLLFFFIALVVLFGIINYSLYKVPKSTLWINKCFDVKEKYANSSNSSKIVFISGSNTLYGMETKFIENEISIPVVNMAIHAGLKTDYILYRAKKVLNSGDIIIIPFEYENLVWNGENSEVRTQYIMTHDKDFFRDELSYIDQLFMIYSIAPSNLFIALKENLQNLVEQEIGKGYASKTLNENGDETYKQGTLEKINHTNHKIFDVSTFQETRALVMIKRFANWCKENNIKMYMTYPNIIYNKKFETKKYKDYFQALEQYYKANEIAVVGTPQDTIFPPQYFYDTHYHMNKVGANIRTKNFLKIMKNQLQLDLKKSSIKSKPTTSTPH